MKRLLVPTALLLSACSGPNSTIYQDSAVLPTLDVPPDILAISEEQNLAVPDSQVGTAAARGRFVEQGELQELVLPKFSQVDMHYEGDLHWLEIEADVVEIYPLLREFWAEEGFPLVKDEPALGILQTAYINTRSGQASADTSFFRRFFSSFQQSDLLDRFRSRVARSDQDGRSRVYFSHRQIERVVYDRTEFKITEEDLIDGWLNKGSDAEKEIELLTRFALFLGVQEGQLEAQQPSGSLLQARSRVLFDDESNLTYVALADNPDRSWFRLRYQLDRLGIDVLDVKDVRIKVQISQEKLNAFAADAPEEGAEIVWLEQQETGLQSTHLYQNREDGTRTSTPNGAAFLRLLAKELS